MLEEIANQMAQNINAEIEKVLRFKLLQIESLAKHRDPVLCAILRSIDISKPEYAKRKLAKHGYTVEYAIPEPEIARNGDYLTATLDANKIKLKIKKLIFEV